MAKRHKKTKIFLKVLIIFALMYTAVALFPRRELFPIKNPMIGDGKVLQIAHRGGGGEFPENTFEAFCNAYSANKNVVMETDVHITRDGVLLLSHDDTLDRNTNIQGKIAEVNYSELIEGRVDFGYENDTEDGVRIGELVPFTDEEGKVKLPTDTLYTDTGQAPSRDAEIFLATTLEDLLSAFPKNLISVEIKDDGELGILAFGEAVRLIEKYDAFDRVLVASFHSEVQKEAERMKAAGEIPKDFMRSASLGSTVAFVVLSMLGLDALYLDEICAFQMSDEEFGINLARESIIAAARRHNIAIHYFTVNDGEDMKRLIDLGVDGIMTDYPHRLAEAAKK